MQLPADTFIAPPCADEIEILFQDDHLLLINKPSGLLSLSGKNPLNKDSVHFRLVQHFPTATLVHRLDFGTSGIIVAALNKTVNAHISQQFQHGLVKKTYVAILESHILADSGEINLPIAKDSANFPLQKICYFSGKKAVTYFEVLERFLIDDAKPATKVVFTPTTGRTHQLRIHSREIDHPILGCDLYMGKLPIQHPRLMLHATTLEFIHPITGSIICVTSRCPF